MAGIDRARASAGGWVPVAYALWAVVALACSGWVLITGLLLSVAADGGTTTAGEAVRTLLLPLAPPAAATALTPLLIRRTAARHEPMAARTALTGLAALTGCAVSFVWLALGAPGLWP
ncbi:hypothetical protein [Kitasatospora sp. NPDC056184]|uniref:hypothetical protein n=1 Tax=Kitasatospora sp. NPDC056184 TaxID=3345738 RepID=UPI0035DF1D9E